MSTPNKPANKPTKATAACGKGPGTKTVMVLDDIKSQIESGLPPDDNPYMVPSKGGKSPTFRAEFVFKVNLRKYMSLQRLVARENGTLSSMITFTSAGSDVDALALPASMYVRDTWGQDGTEILQTVERAMACTKIRAISTTLADDKQVSITVYKDHLLLTIKGGRASFAKILEQLCWLVSVAGDTPTSRLAKFLKETKQGTTIRGYTETIHTGHPVIEASKGCRFHISFKAADVKRLANQRLVRQSGHCWKTMTELSIIASGFKIPSRPREDSGLEAPLFVLRQLIKRGCHGKHPLALDKPLVIFPPSKVGRVDKSGKVVHDYKMRLILAADFEQPPQQQGNVIYWHFDPANICNSIGSLQQLEDKIRVEPSAVGLNSRHFVGWSNDVGHVTAAPGAIRLGVHARLGARKHYELIIPSLSANFRLSQVAGLAVTLTTDKVTTNASIDNMLATLPEKLRSVRARQFVLWDSGRGRGWLVGGDTVALHLLRVRLTYLPGAEDFDFSSLNQLGDGASSAYKVLTDHENLRREVVPEKIGQKSANSDNGQETKDEKDEPKPTKFYEVISGICAVLLQITELALTINDHNGLSGPVQTWFEKHWSATLRGWDFHNIASGKIAQVYVCKMQKDPGWLKMTRELHTPFLFVKGMGDILKPKAGSCCPYFQTLPGGKNFLAADMTVLGSLMEQFGGDEEDNLPDKTLARLSQSQCWERRLNPFARPSCRGDHLNTLDPTCFPVQSFQTASLHPSDDQKNVKRDIKFLKDNPKLYTKGEIQALIQDNPNGVVVFGRQPGSEELQDMYRQSQQNSQSGTQRTVNAAPTAGQTSSRPSSRGSTPGSTGPSPAEADPTLSTQSGPKSSGVRRTDSSLSAESPTPSKKANTQHPQAVAAKRPSSTNSLRSNASASEARGAKTPTKGPGQPSVAPSERAPSVRSIGSTGSSRQRKAAGVDRAEASTPQASPASAQRTASISSVRSTASKTHPRAPSTATGTGQSGTSSPQPLANSARKTASIASLRSNGSDTRPKATVPSSGRPGESTAEPNAPTASRKLSNSSMRTTSSVDSRATGGSNLQIPAAQPPTPALKKSTTDSSDRTTSSRTSRSTQSSAAGSTTANSNQRQQRLGQLSAATAATAMTEGHHPTSSGPAPTAGGGQNG